MKSVIILITVTILFSTVSFSQQRNSSQKKIATSKSLPIDGVYLQTNTVARAFKKMIGFFYNDKVRVRFDKGRAYFVSDGLGIWGNDSQFPPGTVIMNRITMVNPYKYKARWNPLSKEVTNVVIRVEESHLVITFPLKIGGTFDMEYIPIE